MQRRMDRETGEVVCIDKVTIKSSYNREGIEFCAMPENSDRYEVVGRWMEITFESDDKTEFRGMNLGYTSKFNCDQV